MMELGAPCSGLDGEEIRQMSVDSIKKFGGKRHFEKPVISNQL